MSIASTESARKEGKEKRGKEGMGELFRAKQIPQKKERI